MKSAIIFILTIICASQVYAQQSVEFILSEIEKNNTTLAAARKNSDAEKIGNRTGIFIANPEAEFHYLWGNPASIGNRTDFDIRQSFDFPTAYKYKSQISELKNEQAELEYRKKRISILYESELVCAGIIGSNAIHSMLVERLKSAQQIANAYKLKYEAGESSILEYNKAQMNLLNISKEVEKNEIELHAKLSELAMLNGGNQINLTDSVFMASQTDPDFESWYEKAEQQNLVLQWIKHEITISEKQKQQNTALSLPKLNAGYMSEKVIGTRYQGITAGISIPLWENKNTVKYAEAKIDAMQSAGNDAKLQFYNRMKLLHTKVLMQQESVAGYRSSIEKYNNHDLLQKALYKGEISLTEFLLEQNLYYDSVAKLLESELELHKTIAELNQYK